MSKKNQNQVEMDESQVDESAAAETLHANSKPSGDEAKSRLSMIQSMLGKFAEIDNTSLAHLYNGMIAQIGGEGDRAGLGGKSGPNKSSLNMSPSAAVGKIQREELESIFGAQSMSEDFVEKASTLFETAVNVRVLAECARLEETFEEKLAEQLDEAMTQIVEGLEVYLDDAVEKWLEENQVEVVSALESRMAKDFLEDLSDLFKNHNVRVDDSEYEVAEELIQANAELEAALDAKIRELDEIKKELSSAAISVAAEEVLEGLTDQEVSEVSKLFETIDTDDVEEFKKKASIIKEHFVEQGKKGIRKPTLEDSFMSEEVENKDQVVIEDPRVAQYAKVMKRTVRS